MDLIETLRLVGTSLHGNPTIWLYVTQSVTEDLSPSQIFKTMGTSVMGRANMNWSRHRVSNA